MQVTTVFATKLRAFTFVPLLKRLPVENRVWKRVFQTNRAKETGDSEKSMEQEGVYKAEVIYIQDLDDGQRGEDHSQSEASIDTFGFSSHIQSPDSSSFKQASTPADPPPASNCTTLETSPPSMETTDNKHPGISQLDFHNMSEAAAGSSGLFINSSPHRQEAISPANSADFLNSLMSSKESILSEGWEKERSWSELHMFSRDCSRAVSPCSSIRSGTFTPSVVKIKRHSLAPGSSLLNMSSTCETPCCESGTTSPCPLSPHSRHRTPPTQLSLLTAILRKGRLPVLSSYSQRPYTPCWPIRPVNLSSCLACTAASSVAPMNAPKAKSCLNREKPWRESDANISRQFDKSAQRVMAPDKSPPRKPAEKLNSSKEFPDRTQNVVPNISLAQPPKDHFPKSSQKRKDLASLPSSPFFSSNTRYSSPKSSSPSCICEENLQDCHGSTGTNRSIETSSMNPVGKKMYARSDKNLWALKQSIEPFELSDETCSPQNLTSPMPTLAQNPPKPSFLNPTFGSHSTSPDLTLSKNKIQNELSSPTFGQSPSPRPTGLTRLSYTPPASPACRPVSRTSRTATPERYTLSPSPSYSCSSLSSSLWGSTPDCADGDSKNRKTYKIKSSYKALAAIPTNTLLLEQQVISVFMEHKAGLFFEKVVKEKISGAIEGLIYPSVDVERRMKTEGPAESEEYVFKFLFEERDRDHVITVSSSSLDVSSLKAIDEEVDKEASFNPADNYSWEDPHAEMCSPAQLRQQTSELFATIDEVLEEVNQSHQPNHVNKAVTKCLAEERATAPFQFSLATEKAQTKPGVIKPVIATSRCTDEKHKDLHLLINQGNKPNRYQYKFVRSWQSDEAPADVRGASEQPSASAEAFSLERHDDFKSRLASLIAQSRISGPDVLTSISTRETHI
ncbi:hypothetical protein DNTS_014050 [Danionella cerebrum]|uniref:Muscular LMNA-interacting protein n=1 Tax=Danionella cerebrum TaxID=2873325 RepID=A0A553NIK7_9TELE|nr:hypothetical protein DNTS_014050 [Danionella translucida]